MKNIVICCDGTNNQLETDPSNVLRLYSMLERDPQRQVTFYDPGVGTLSQPGVNSAIGKRLSLIYGLAFGVGFTRNLEEAYRFLIWNYDPGDRVFLFGFSRGAFTARALAGMVDMFGLLDREQVNLLPYVSRAYKAANFHVANRFKKICRRRPPIDFLGVWDTVSSLGFLYKRLALPGTANNGSVHVVRHALAIDERRAYFRQNLWGARFAAQQDVKQVWFAGVHSDIGGGYPANESDLAKITLEWMVAEARRPGPHTELLIDDDQYWKVMIGDAAYQKALAAKQPPVFEPNAAAKAHESLVSHWWIGEFLPMNYTLRRREFFLPLGQRRQVAPDATIHQSVIDRMHALGAAYRPPNLGHWANVEPWSHNQGTPAPPPSERLWTRLRPILSAFAWVIGAAYVAMMLLFVLGFIVRHFLPMPASPRNWGQMAFDVAFWPYVLFDWLMEPTHVRKTLLVLGPLIVLKIGSLLLGWFSGLPRFAPRVHEKLLHLRWQGYSTDRAQKQLHALMADGRVAYALNLKLDLLFPLVYGLALHWSLAHAREIADVLPHWIGVLPVIPVLADWTENLVLLGQIRRFDTGLQAGAIRVASIATMVKIATVTAALLTPLGLALWACFAG